MPSQRKKSTKMFGAYIPKEEYDVLKKEAKRRGITLAGLLRERVQEYISKLTQ